jgi:F-type H+-transporting ATPase subunit b
MNAATIAKRCVVIGSLFVAFAAPALGQEHGTTTEHTQQAEHGEQGEHGEHGASAHHEPDSINWTSFGGTHADHSGVQKPNPPPFIATLINFGLLAAILLFAVKRSINPSLASRRAALEAEIAEAQRLRAEAEAMHREYSDRLEQADTEFAQLRSDMVKAGEADAQRIVDEARVRAERMQTEGQALIEQEIRSLRTELKRDAVEAAMKSAEASVKQAVNAQDQARLADAFLDGFEKSSTQRGTA